MQIRSNDVFRGSIDTTDSTKDANYIATKVKQYIPKMGPKNIDQMYFDNAAAMKNVANNISQEWPQLYWQGFAVHYLHLLLKC